MITPQKIVAAARRWKDTPYAHQGRGMPEGLDCGGLIIVVCNELGILHNFEHLGYSNAPDGATFENLLEQNLDRIEPKESAQPGDILAIDYGDGVQHTAFVTALAPRLTVVHAKRGERRGVVEQYLYGRDQRGWKYTYRVRGLANV